MGLKRVPSLKIHFVTFADAAIARFTHERLRKQLSLFSIFSSARLLTETDLDRRFTVNHGYLMSPGSRGFGFWIWKPEVIREALASVGEGDFVVYADAGCHLVASAENRLLDWCELMMKGEFSVLAWSLDHPEYRYSKPEILSHFGIVENNDEWHSPQLSASVIVLRKDSISMRFVRDWALLASHRIDLLDDSYAAVVPSDFVETRHDQSLFSLLAKTAYSEKVASLQISEQFPLGGGWNELRESPIQIRRDKFDSNLLEQVRRRLVDMRENLSRCF